MSPINSDGWWHFRIIALEHHLGWLIVKARVVIMQLCLGRCKTDAVGRAGWFMMA